MYHMFPSSAKKNPPLFTYAGNNQVQSISAEKKKKGSMGSGQEQVEYEGAAHHCGDEGSPVF